MKTVRFVPKLLTLLSLYALFAAHQTNATMRPLLAKVAGLAWAGGAVAHSAHYWRNQYKPFKDDAERDAVLKDMILNQSTFTSSWDPKMCEIVHKYPQAFCVKFGNQTGVTECHNTNMITLHLGTSETNFHNSHNRAQLKTEAQNYGLTLGHEGTHVAQGLRKIDEMTQEFIDKGLDPVFFSRGIENDADIEAIDIIVKSTMSPKQQLHLLKIAQRDLDVRLCPKYHKTDAGPLCAQPDSPHPPCAERIARIEDAIQKQILPVLRIEQAAETMHPAWDFAAA